MIKRVLNINLIFLKNYLDFNVITIKYQNDILIITEVFNIKYLVFIFGTFLMQ